MLGYSQCHVYYVPCQHKGKLREYLKGWPSSSSSASCVNSFCSIVALRSASRRSQCVPGVSSKTSVWDKNTSKQMCCFVYIRFLLDCSRVVGREHLFALEKSPALQTGHLVVWPGSSGWGKAHALFTYFFKSSLYCLCFCSRCLQSGQAGLQEWWSKDQMIRAL